MKAITLVIISCCFIGQLLAQEETRSLSNFDEISIKGAGTIYLTQGNKNEITIRLDDRSYELSDITTEVVSSTLEIDYENQKWFNNSPDMELWITYKQIEKIVTDGASKILTKNVLKAESLSLECNGAQNAEMELDVETLVAKISGAGSFTLSGRATNQMLTVSGAGQITALDLIGQTVEASVDGVGSITAYAEESMEGEVNGVGKIRFGGNPRIQKLNSDGVGSVKPIN